MKPLMIMAPAALALAAGLTVARAQDNDWSVIQRGLYLTRVGDCAACHTIERGEPFAGGFPLATPFGTIYSANLTPDVLTGLGAWNADDFHRAMNEGRAKDGTRLYPAFPYTHFTYVTREDTDAIFAYLNTLEPVRNVVRPPDLQWPLEWRFLMAGWNLLNFEPRDFQPEADRSPAYNRGKYLAEGLMHCSACHTPKNIIGAEEDGDARFSGGMAEVWWAPALKGGERSGIGDWSKQQIVDFLKYGRNERTTAFGPMADVVRNSTRHMTLEDLDAVATYIKEMPGGEAAQAAAVTRDIAPEVRNLGALVYDTQCSACHAPEGEGVTHMFPPLKDSSFVQADNPHSVIRLILEGGKAVPTEKFPTPHKMPAFDWKLTDDEVAAVASYVRNNFGNSAAPVTAGQVAEVRND
jgi:mono/diheme cytochrome c family protein